MDADRNTPPSEEGLSGAALFYGIVVLFLLLLFAGATVGVSSVALVGWLILLVGWVSFWVSKRRR